MAGYAAAIITTLKALQLLLASLQAYLGIGGNFCPASSTIDTITSISSFDYIVVGAGEAGSVLIYRLAKYTNASILVLEEGGCPPLESNLPGLFTTLPLSGYDRQMNIYNDSYACQNVRAEGSATAGKMIGGSSALNHLINVPPTPSDFDKWSAAANDSSWGFPDYAYYFAKGETVKDKGVLAQNTNLHGTCGPAQLKRQQSASVLPLIAAYEELGLTYKNDSYGQCTNEPLLYIDNCGLRQSGTVSFLNKINNTNVYFLSGAVADRILFNGTKAVGVQFTYSGVSYNATANKKVVVSAGAIRSPQLLILSGIGDPDTLAGLNITSVVNNTEVGQNFMDHPSAVLCIALENDTDTASAADYRQFPVSMLTAYAASTANETVITRQDINLLLPAASSGFLQLCAYGFKYDNAICDAWYEYNLKRKMVFMVINYMHPLSRGSITPNSTNMTDQPIIKQNLLSNSDDLDKFAALFMSAAQIVNTTALQAVGAEIADVGVCSNTTKFTLDYWKCYMLALSAGMWHYSGTCMMGKVVDNELSVIGTSNLMVVDASIFPYMTTGNIASVVRATAEKATDIILTKDGYTISSDICY